MASGHPAAVIGQGTQHDAGVLGKVGLQRLRLSVKAVAAQKQGVVLQGHAVLARPRRGAEATGTVDEDYPLLIHDPTLWQRSDIGAGRHDRAPYLPPRNLSKPLGRFSWDGSKSPDCWPKEAPVGTALAPAARRASASRSSWAALAGLPERAFFLGAFLPPLRAPPAP